MTPDEIEQLFSSSPALLTGQPQGDGSHGEEGGQTSLSSGETTSLRTESLGPVLATVKHLQETGSEQLDAVAEKIGNGARDAAWRIPLGESQLLDFFMGIIGETGTRRSLTVHSLRVIGNACADTDKNRQRLVEAECLPKIVNLLQDNDYILLVVPVLFNICVDYEPAQVAAYKAGLNTKLVDLISGPRHPNAVASMSIICKLLRLVASQEPEANLVHPDTPYILVKLAVGQESLADPEDFVGQASVALTYLAHQQFQDSFLDKPNAILLFLQVFSRFCREVGSQLDSEELEQLKQVQSVFMQVLADLSAHSQFAALCTLEGPEVETLRGWISSPHIQLQSSACLALGNIARSDDACVWLVETAAVHKPLIATLSDASKTDAQLLHSTLSFLKNLSIPAANKVTIGDAGIFDARALPRLWQISTQPQVQFAAVSLTRLLLVNCPGNVRRVVNPASSSSPDPTAPARDSQSPIHVLMDVFKQTDQEPTKMEAARAVLSVCRVLHTDTSSIFASGGAPSTEEDPGATSGPSGSRSLPKSLEGFYTSHAQLTGALLFLGSQKKYPLLRSEVWFVLALMVRSDAGAKVVAGLMQHRELLEALSEAVTGKNILEGREGTTGLVTDGPGAPPSSDDAPGDVSSGLTTDLGLEPQQVDPKQVASLTKVDRENGLVLIHELVRLSPDDSAPLPLDILQQILKEGGDLVLADRAGTA